MRQRFSLLLRARFSRVLDRLDSLRMQIDLSDERDELRFQLDFQLRFGVLVDFGCALDRSLDLGALCIECIELDGESDVYCDASSCTCFAF